MSALIPGDHQAPWLHSLPEHSRVVPLKHVVDVNPEVLPESTPPDRPIRYIDIGNVDSQGRILEVQAFRFEDAPSRARRVVRRGDVIVSTVRTYLRAIARIDEEDPSLVASTGFAVLRARKGQMWPGFLGYWMRATPVVDEICARSVGVSYPATNPSEVGALPVHVPPLANQRAIADFLDRKTAAIDEVIAQKEELLGLLAEQRAALIHRAVTKGLDPDVETKESGDPWFGEVPAHWDVAKIGLFAKVQNGSTPSRSEATYWSPAEVPWVSSGQVNDYVVTEASEWISRRGMLESNLRIVPKGSVLVGMIGQGRTRGMSAMMAIDACINQNVAAVTPVDDRLNSRFLHLLMQHSYEPLREAGRGGNQAALNCELISSFRIPVPPRAEQDAILAAVDSHVSIEAEAQKSIADQVAAMREYRQALITSAVTGKLDIPNSEANDGP